MKTTTPLFSLASLLVFLGSVVASAGQGGPGELIYRDDFQGHLGEGWTFEREERAHWRTGPRGLEVRVQPGGMWGGGNNARNVMVHPIPAPADAPIEIAVTVSNLPSAQWEQANLVWYYDAGNMVKLGQELVTGRLSIVMGREENDRARTVAIIPLDACTVELRLQAFKNLVRGQFRTAPWREWRDVGECDLPVKGNPNASLHFYNGPANEEHWVRVNEFTVRRLPAGSVDWPRVRAEEKTQRAADSPRMGLSTVALPGEFRVLSEVKSISGEPQANYEQTIYRHRDGTCGWHWNRRSSASKSPTAAGVGVGVNALWPGAPQGGFEPVAVAALKSLELEMDAVTRLENDQGDHNLVVVLPLKPAGRVAIWFDWYGKASDVKTLNDGYRDFGFVPTPTGDNEFQYRIAGFRGAPPRINLKSFLDDAIRRGLGLQSEVQGVWFGNEIWNGSLGATLVTRLDLIVNGRRLSSVPVQTKRP